MLLSKELHATRSRGLIRTILIVVVAIVALSYFGFDIKNLFESPQNRKNFSYVTTQVIRIWHTHLEKPATYLWHDIFITLIWNPAVGNLKKINAGQPTDIEHQGPALPSVPNI